MVLGIWVTSWREISQPVCPAAPPPLLVYNWTVALCEKLSTEAGGEGKIRIAQSAAQLALACDIVVTDLSNDGLIVSRTFTRNARKLLLCVIHVFLQDFVDVELTLMFGYKETPPNRNKIFDKTGTVFEFRYGLSQHFC